MKGFTLIELVLTIVIMAILLVTIGPILGQAMLSLQRGHELWNVSQQGQVAQNRLAREIQGATALTTAAAGQLTLIDAGNNLIDFRLTSGSLMRQQNSNTPQVLADQVSSLTFTYWDRNNLATTTLANVRCVKSTMVVTDGLGEHTFDGTWCPRALQ